MTGFLSLLGRVLRGMRLLEFVALMLLLVMVLGVYLEKAGAGRERGEIVAVQARIDDDAKRLRLLQAEVAHLEEPSRMELLSAALGLGPTQPRQEEDLADLPRIASGAIAAPKAAGAAPAQPGASR